MVSVVRCWKAEYQKCKHSILLYMHSMIPIICAAIFAGYDNIDEDTRNLYRKARISSLTVIAAKEGI